MKLSIVIPVYNVEKYIKDCIISCIDQIDVSPDDYEIIIVNDGTKDDSMRVIQSTITNRQNIIVVNKLNGGLSSARNAGLKVAKGDYVWFVDSDDSIINDAVKSTIYNITNNSEPDVLFYDINITYESGLTGTTKKMYKSDRITTETGPFWLENALEMWPMAQMYVFKRSFLIDNSLYFKEGILHEDVEYKFRMLLQAKRVSYIPEPRYNYLIRNTGSISSEYSPKRAADLLWIIGDEYRLYKTLQAKYKPAAGYALFRNIDNYTSFVTNNKSSVPGKEINEFKRIIRNIFYVSFWPSSFAYKTKMMMAYISPKLLIMYYSIKF